MSDLDEVSNDICIPARSPFTISASHLADEVTSFYITRHDHYGLGTGKKANSNLDRRYQGPKVILYDMWRAQGWDILSHGGFVSYFHHDASGLSTFVFPRSGSKIWGYARIKKECSPQQRKDLFNMFDAILEESGQVSPSVVMGTVLIEEGDIL